MDADGLRAPACNTILMDLLQHSFLVTVAGLVRHAAGYSSVYDSVCMDLAHFHVKYVQVDYMNMPCHA